MSLDPTTPVLVGYGQVNQRDENPDSEPIDLMEAAARAAAKPRVLKTVDALRVVNVLSLPYRDPGLLLAQRIDATTATTSYTPIGGNVPQSLVNQACLDIQHGRNAVVLITGAETWRTRSRLNARGKRLTGTVQDDSVPLAPRDPDFEMAAPAQFKIGLIAPSHIYPMFEQALRIEGQATIEHHRRSIGELWSRFSKVAQANPHAWSREAVNPEQIWQAGTGNRMISWPYTKLMNSNNMVDQGAALVLTSVQKAVEFQIPKDDWVFPHSGTDAHDTYRIAERASFAGSPAIRLAGRRALELANIGIDDLNVVDLYSCFPSAVQVAAKELGLPLDDPQRPLSVTGGLTFAGGPWNNYVTHSIATMAERLTAAPGEIGLITANGGYLTKHSFGVYSTKPPKRQFRWDDIQPAVEAQPMVAAEDGWSGTGIVETWTTPMNRDGVPEKVFVAVRTPAGNRALAVITDASQAEASIREDLAGANVAVKSDGIAELW